jgi:hypothetical protein
MELAVDVEIDLRQRPAWVLRFVPDGNGALDAMVIIFAARPLRCFAIDRCLVEPCSSRRIDAPVLLISRFPLGQAEPFAHIILAGERVVAREGEDDEASRRARLDTDRK